MSISTIASINSVAASVDKSSGISMSNISLNAVVISSKVSTAISVNVGSGIGMSMSTITGMSTVGSSISTGASNTITPAISSSIVCSNVSTDKVSPTYICSSIFISGSTNPIVSVMSKPLSIIMSSTISVNVVPPISSFSNISIASSI